MIAPSARRPRLFRSARVLALASVLATTLLPRPAAASLDIAELYLRKIKLGERTFFQDGGWARWRNSLDLFYETEWIPGAGSTDPRFSTPAGDGSAFATWSLGGIALLTKQRSDLQLSVFSILTGTGRVEISNDTAMIFLQSVVATVAVPFIPQAFQVDGTSAVTQQITGFQLRYRGWVEGTYGLLTDDRNGTTLYRNFVETNVPLVFLTSNLVTSPAADKLERLLLAFRYDTATWASDLRLGLAVQNVNQERKFIVADFDQILDVLSGGLRLNIDEGFAEGRLGVHLSTYPNGSAKRNGKFGFAYDFRAFLSVLDIQKANLWSSQLAEPGLTAGGTAEVYLQFPGVLLLAFFAAASAADAKNEEDRQNMLETATNLADLASEDDRVYSGLTLGVAYNDAETLREVPAAKDALHFYIRLRILY